MVGVGVLFILRDDKCRMLCRGACRGICEVTTGSVYGVDTNMAAA